MLPYELKGLPLLEIAASFVLAFVTKVSPSRAMPLVRGGVALPGKGLTVVTGWRSRRTLSPEALQLLMSARQSGDVYEPPGVEGRLAVSELKRAGYIEWVTPLLFFLGDEIPYRVTESGDQRIGREIKRRTAA